MSEEKRMTSGLGSEGAQTSEAGTEMGGVAYDTELSLQRSEDRRIDETVKRNDYGRVKNAENSSMAFYPHSVLRFIAGAKKVSVSKDESGGKNAAIGRLAEAMMRGEIGPFEVSITSWVGKLRYLSKSNLQDLLRGGHLYQWQGTHTTPKKKADKLTDVLNRMEKYNLIEQANFVMLDDDGRVIPEKHSSSRSITLGYTGGVLMMELGNKSPYRAYDILRDGNDVKRYLAANQWLIYWLSTFPKQVADYDAGMKIFRRGTGLTGARIYASVTCGKRTLAAEPVRRVEPFETGATEAEIRGKYHRFLELFGHLDELYVGEVEYHYPSRPVLVYVCEDDEHMRYVAGLLYSLIREYPEQEVWFTTDRRIYNYDQVGKRFTRLAGEDLELVNLEKETGLIEYPAMEDGTKQILADKEQPARQVEPVQFNEIREEASSFEPVRLEPESESESTGAENAKAERPQKAQTIPQSEPFSILFCLQGEKKIRKKRALSLLHLQPEIDQRELENAVKTYAAGIKPQDVIAMGITNPGKKGKEGFLLTEKDLVSSSLKPGVRLPLRSLKSVSGKRSGIFIELQDGRSMEADFGKANSCIITVLEVIMKGSGEEKNLR